jgi:hypothetical protein
METAADMNGLCWTSICHSTIAHCKSTTIQRNISNWRLHFKRHSANNFLFLVKIAIVMKSILIFCLVAGCFLSCRSQPPAQSPRDMAAAADTFLKTLSSAQVARARFSFDGEERYNWHFVPRSRKGIALEELSAPQRSAALALLHFGLSDTGYLKATSIIGLEDVLREVEGRPAGDDYRDPGNYYFTVFGNPASDSVWGWRIEGHHISLNFSSRNNRIVSGTPGFFGANPAVVLSGPEKGKQILKDETELGFSLLHSLNVQQKQKAVINDRAPSDILTSASRKAMIDDQRGILYSELNASQQKLFLQLLSIYIHRYTRMFATTMMREIETAGLSNLRFAWAGAQQNDRGNPHYYRLQGPTIIIEYDNTQNNANHVHTVVRDLKNDFGGDELMEHYRKTRH